MLRDLVMQELGDDEPLTVEVEAHCPHVPAWAFGLEVQVERNEHAWIVEGPDLHLFLARMDPRVWGAGEEHRS